jgi:hypothetical protein
MPVRQVWGGQAPLDYIPKILSKAALASLWTFSVSRPSYISLPLALSNWVSLATISLRRQAAQTPGFHELTNPGCTVELHLYY